MHHCIQEELSIKDVYTIHQLQWRPDFISPHKPSE